MLIIFLLVAFKTNVCVIGSGNTKSEECLRCAVKTDKSECVTFEQLSEMNLKTIKTIYLISNFNLNFSENHVTLTSSNNQIQLQSAYTLVLNFYSKNAIISIIQTGEFNGTFRTKLYSTNNIFYHFLSPIDNLPIDLNPKKNISIYSNFNVYINGSIRVPQSYNLSFYRYGEIGQISKINFSCNLYIYQPSLLIMKSSRYDLIIPHFYNNQQTASNFSNLLYTITPEGVSTICIHNSSYPISGPIGINIITSRLTSTSIEHLINRKRFRILILPQDGLTQMSAIVPRFILSNRPGFFGLWGSKHILKEEIENSSVYISFRPENVENEENNLCYSTSFECPRFSSIIEESLVSNLVEFYIPSYSKKINIIVLSNMQFNFISLNQMPNEAQINIFGMDRTSFKPNIYLKSTPDGTPELSVFSFRHLNLFFGSEHNVCKISSPFSAYDCDFTNLDNTRVVFTNSFSSNFNFFRELPQTSLENVHNLTVTDCNNNLDSIIYNNNNIIVYFISLSNKMTSIILSLDVSTISFELTSTAIVKISTDNNQKQLNLNQMTQRPIQTDQINSYHETIDSNKQLNSIRTINHNINDQLDSIHSFSHQPNLNTNNQNLNEHTNKDQFNANNPSNSNNSNNQNQSPSNCKLNSNANDSNDQGQSNSNSLPSNLIQAKEIKSCQKLTFGGFGFIYFDENYNPLNKDLLPIHINGSVGIIISNASLPNFFVDSQAQPYYTLFSPFSGYLQPQLQNVNIPLYIPDLTIEDFSIIDIAVPIYIESLVVNQRTTLQLPTSNILKSISLKRGSKILPKTARNSISIANDTIIRIEWRSRSIPKLILNTLSDSIPKKIVFLLDIQYPNFIDIHDYMENHYMKYSSVIEGIPASVCNEWIKKAQFMSVIDVFDDKNCSINLTCMYPTDKRLINLTEFDQLNSKSNQNDNKSNSNDQNEFKSNDEKFILDNRDLSDENDLMNIYFYIGTDIHISIANKEPSPTRHLPKANSHYISGIVIAVYVLIAIAILTAFCFIRKRKLDHYELASNSGENIHISSTYDSDSSVSTNS